MNNADQTPARPDLSRPDLWHRTLCPVTEQVLLCGDLAPGVAAARAQLQGWVEAGVTHILDVRLDQEVGFDVELVAAYAPHVTYLRAGVDDSGRSQDDAWFDAGVDAALEALADPAAKIVVHCHMGVNRGPSMAFAILLAAGWEPVPALEAIRQARPIAAIVYANDAVAWWLRRNGATDAEIGDARTAVTVWRWSNPVQVGWIISRIRRCA